MRKELGDKGGRHVGVRDVKKKEKQNRRRWGEDSRNKREKVK